MQYVEFVRPRAATIASAPHDPRPMSGEIAGHTLYSLISVGTEINSVYLDALNWGGYPRVPGYASVFEVSAIGEGVETFQPGDIALIQGSHASWQKCRAAEAVKIPPTVRPEHAPFVRMAAVSMATLSHTSVLPGEEKLLVTGLGCVGLMAMQVYSHLGYQVIGVDPDPGRRAIAAQYGLSVYEHVPMDDDAWHRQIALALECSGHEGAVLDCIRMVRERGEVSVVGVPWKQCAPTTAHELLNALFYGYVKLYSGWEMDLPFLGGGRVHEYRRKHFDLALNLLRSNAFTVDGLYAVRPYQDVQNIYDDLYLRHEPKMSVLIDWRGAEAART